MRSGSLHAISGSTNAILHLIAYAGRLGVDLPLSLFDELCATTPWLVDLKPAGDHLMEDFFYAGGLPAVLEQIRDLLDLDALTVTGRTLGENLDGFPTEIVDERVIRPRSNPLDEGGSLVVLHGNLCPDGAVMKISAADPRLLGHEGRAVVFEDIHDLASRVDDPGLDVDADSVMVLRNAGPVGAPGMPEWGHLPIPAKLLKQGVTDLVRHLGCADERHLVRLRRPSRRAGVRGRRSACARRDRRPDQAGCRAADASTCSRRGRAGAPARRLEPSAAQGRARLPTPVRGPRAPGERGL